MKVKINSKESEISVGTVLALSEQLSLPEKGVAIAVNNKMIPRSEWEAFSLAENDSIVIIKAACGG